MLSDLIEKEKGYRNAEKTSENERNIEESSSDMSMSREVNNNHGFLQILADCPTHQRQFLLKTATPQQLHALVQVLYNILMEHISIPEENNRILQTYKDALLDLARPNVPYKTKKRVLVQEGSGFIEDVLAPVVSSLGFLML